MSQVIEKDSNVIDIASPIRIHGNFLYN